MAFRLGLLTDDAIERTLAAFTPLVASGRPLRLGGGMAHVRGIACQPGRHPLMRSTSYPALADQASDSTRITLHFTSPTSFRAGDVQEILPRPERVFGSRLRTWQAFAPVALDPDLADALVQLQASAYDLRTELVHFTLYKVIGFTGRVTYTYPRTIGLGQVTR